MFLRKMFRNAIFLVMLILTLSTYLQALAAPSITTATGDFSEGHAITISGTGFGSTGPNILVYDTFDGGTAGSLIEIGSGSATIGGWTGRGGGDGNNPPIYSTSFKVSGDLAMRGDYTVKTSSGTDSSSSVQVTGTSFTQAFLSYWFFLPTTSEFPGSSDDNWKLGWFLYTPGEDEDLLVFEMLGASSEKDMGCNNCYVYGGWPNNSNYVVLQPNFTFQKGSWYRVHMYVKGTYDYTGKRQLWTISPDESMSVTKRVDWTGRQWNEEGNYWNKFVLNPWARWCDGCSESYGFFDDVYLAIGSNAQARVEIGDASAYSNCTNLSICTINSWSTTSIGATFRQGSFSAGSAYLYVIDSAGVNSSGYPITVGGSPPAYECNDGIDNDSDGLIDYPDDPGCASSSDNDESNSYECSDGIDNDSDGLIDYPDDPGCASSSDNDESNSYECSDGIDNDSDGSIDYPDDPGCSSSLDDSEYNDPQPEGIVEAESGSLTSPMVEVSDGACSGGAYIHSTSGSSGSATYTVNLNTSGIYKIVVRVYALNDSSDSFYVQIDDQEEILWDLNPSGNPDDFNVWREDEVTSRGTGTFDDPQYDPYTTELSQGVHTITFRCREPNARLDYFYFSKVSDTSPPNPPSGFTIKNATPSL